MSANGRSGKSTRELSQQLWISQLPVEERVSYRRCQKDSLAVPFVSSGDTFRLHLVDGGKLISPNFWNDVGALSFENEADVETKLVLPLLHCLGYLPNDIRSKQAIDFRMGREKRKGRKPEADFVVYGGEPHGRATSLMVVEAKRPSEKLDDALKQAESYASALRAPLVMLTNGRSIELWQLQPTGENVLAFQASVGELTSRRGQFEMLAGVGAVTELCRTLGHKRLDLLNYDITVLEQHEHRRLGPAKGTIRRVLRKKNSPGKTTSEVLLEECPRGAIILGPSGYGKSTLASMLVREAIEARWEARRESLSFELFLPDVADYPGGVENYLFERVSRHVPAMTQAGLRDLIRRRGVVIVADALERVTSTSRDGVFSALRTFARDYPRAQIFLMSRYTDSRVQELDLPEFELEPYSEEDFRSLLRAKGIVEPEHFGRVSAMPEHLKKLCREPLIAELVARSLNDHSKYPTHIVPLYEEWLNQIFRAFDPIQKLTLRVLLSDIAGRSIAAAIPFKTARELALLHGLDADVLSKLSDANAIATSGSTIELSHEALADYLRALSFLENAGADVENQVQLIDFEATSQFPRLLLAVARTPPEGLAIWRAIVKKDLGMGIDALQFTHGGGTASLHSEDLRAKVLSDLLDGYDTIVEAHFTPMRSELASAVAGRPINILGVAGTYDEVQASYSFVSVDPGLPRVVLKEEDNPSIAYGMDLAALGYRGDGGRVLGVSAVTSALADLLKRRALRGGRVFKEEMVLGRLRHLARHYGLPLIAPYDLRAGREILLPMQQQYVRPRDLTSGQSFEISELLEQIDYLLEAGVTELREWCDIRKMDLSIPEHRAVFAAQLHDFHQRRQRAYLEIVEHSFPTLRSNLPAAIQIPHRVLIQVNPDTEPMNRVSVDYREVPVETIAEAGADVSFPGSRSNWTSRSAVEAHHQENLRRLASLEVARANYVSHTGWANFHGFFVSRWDGSGNADETAVIRDAISWLQSDFQSLFDKLPGLSKF